MEDLFIYRRALTESEIPSLMNARLPAIFANSPEKRTSGESDVIFIWWLQNRNPEYSRLERKYDRLLQEQSEIIARSTTALVMQEKAELPISYVLHRGEYDQREEKLGPATPAMLPAFPAGFPRNRLGFARWLLLPSHPLTSRVTVNRFWSEIFGTGLVKTAGDFGVQGELPSHPELLDWLAVDFCETGWDVKRLLRLIVTSATYRQTNMASPESIERDPENRLLSHGPRFRMDAEMVRDYALSASGLLSPKIGGPSVRPYQPRGVWEAVAMLQSNTRTYQQDVGDSVYRRSMYTFWKRAAPPASMDIFNAPAREVCTMVRERTNTPLQALVTMNDPQFVEAARQLAQRAIEANPSTKDRLQFVAERLLARQLHSDEMEVVQKSLQQFENYFSTAPKDAAKLVKVGDSMADTSISAVQLAAWTMVANQMMNLDEVLNK